MELQRAAAVAVTESECDSISVSVSVCDYECCSSSGCWSAASGQWCEWRKASARHAATNKDGSQSSIQTSTFSSSFESHIPDLAPDCE